MTQDHDVGQDSGSAQDVERGSEAAAVTPPGHLPAQQVAARQAALRWQFRHDNTTRPLAPGPGEAVEVRATTGEHLLLEEAEVLYTTDGSLPGEDAMTVPMCRDTVEWDALAGYVQTWSARLPAQDTGTIVRYRVKGRATSSGPGQPGELWAQDGQGFHFHDMGSSRITTFAYATEASPRTAPPWVKDAVIYQIFLDRFHSGGEEGMLPPGQGERARHGGTLRGVRRALDYLTDLGVTCLWLSPLCRSETYHGYDATDLYVVDPDFGTEEDLRDLVQAAHERGLRVLLDLVPNHCSWHHPAFLAAQRDRAAPSAPWFLFDQWPERYRTFLGSVPSLPAFNTDDSGAREHIIGSALHWMAACGVDGFRLDHAIGPSMDFWVAFRAATRRQNPLCFSVGEATDTPDALLRYAGRLDSVLDFVLARALRSTFGTGEWNVEQFDSVLDMHERYAAAGADSVSFLDNHDMNRFLFVAGGDTRRLRLAALCQFSLQAVPALYYGTEVGMGQEADIHEVGDAEARKDMPWDRMAWDEELLSFYRSLIRLRTTWPSLRSGARRRLRLDREAGTYAYLRTTGTDAAAAGDMVAVFNLSDQQRTLSIPLRLVNGGIGCLLSSGPTPRVEHSPAGVVVTLPPLSSALLGIS